MPRNTDLTDISEIIRHGMELLGKEWNEICDHVQDLRPDGVEVRTRSYEYEDFDDDNKWYNYSPECRLIMKSFMDKHKIYEVEII